MIETKVKVNTFVEVLKNPTPCEAEATLKVSQLCGELSAIVCTHCTKCKWDTEVTLDTAQQSGRDFVQAVSEVHDRVADGLIDSCDLLR